MRVPPYDPACENRRLHVRIAELETEQEILLNLLPHNDAWGLLMDDEDVEEETKKGYHGVDPKPPRALGHGWFPEPCRRCLAEATLKGESSG